jgi:organic hydroperoxide reductase OsmC/OhrA
MPGTHRYETTTTWTGNTGEGTAAYRSHQTAAEGRPAIAGSSDPASPGDAERWNPERLLVAALIQCHLLAYLHECAVGGLVMTAYVDQAAGTMAETPDGGGHFPEVVLRPEVTVADAAMTACARELHEAASELCFIANSVNFPVRHEPEIVVAQAARSGG